MNPFRSRGIFWWQVPSVLQGDPDTCAQLLSEHGFESVYIKTGYKAWAYRPVSQLSFGQNVRAAMVDALHRKGISVVGWAYVYGGSWRWQEADLAAKMVNELGLDGFVWNVEIPYDSSGTGTRDAQDTCVRFREQANVPMAFCSWAQFRSPSGGTWHDDGYARKFMEYCDVGMPMVYWGTNQEPGVKLQLSINDWSRFDQGKPIIPAGRAYNGDGGDATPESMALFVAAVNLNELEGMTWWVLDQAANPKYQDGAILQALKWANAVFWKDVTEPEPDPEPEPTPPIEPEPGELVTGKLLYGMSLRISAKVIEGDNNNQIGYLFKHTEVEGKLVPEGANLWLEMDGGSLGVLYVAHVYNNRNYIELDSFPLPPIPEPEQAGRENWKSDPNRPAELYYSRHTEYFKVPVYATSSLNTVQFEAPHSAIFLGDRIVNNHLHVIRMNDPLEEYDGWIDLGAEKIIHSRIPENVLNSTIPPKVKEPEIKRFVTATGNGYYIPHERTKPYDYPVPDTVVLWTDKPHHPGWIRTTPELQWLMFDLFKVAAPGFGIIYYVMADAYHYRDNGYWTDRKEKDKHRDDILGQNPNAECFFVKDSITTRGNYRADGGGIDITKPLPLAEDIINRDDLVDFGTQQYPEILANGKPKNTHMPSVKQEVNGNIEKTGSPTPVIKSSFIVNTSGFERVGVGDKRHLINLERDQA